MPRSLITLLALLVALSFTTTSIATAAPTPSAKRCKAVKVKKRKTKRDRAVLAACRKKDAKASAKKSATPNPKLGSAAPIAGPPAPPAVSAPVPTPDTAAQVATPTPVAPPVATPTPQTPQVPIGTGRAVQVRGSEFRPALSRLQVLAGNVRVEYNLTSAEDPHSLIVFRRDGTGPTYHFAEQRSRAIVAQSLALTTGTWRLVCDLPGHEAAGMKAELEVG